MLLWRQRSSLLFLLALWAVSQATDHKKDNTTPTASIVSRKMDVDRQGGALAGPMFLGLATMLFPVLPVLLLAPLAMAGIGPAMNYISDALGGGSSGSSSPTASASSSVGNFLNTLGSSSNSADQQSSQSALSSVAQALGLSSSSDSQESSGSLLSSLFGSGSSGSSGSSSLLSSLFEGPSNTQGLFAPAGGNVFGNQASGSRPVPAIALPPQKAGNSQTGMTAADILGAAAAALDNAGVLGSLGALSSGGAGLSQLLNGAIGGNSKPGSSPLTDILSGLGTGLGSQPAASAPIGHKLPISAIHNANVMQGIPVQGGIPAGIGGGNVKPSSGFVSSLLGMGSNSGTAIQFVWPIS